MLLAEPGSGSFWTEAALCCSQLRTDQLKPVGQVQPGCLQGVHSVHENVPVLESAFAKLGRGSWPAASYPGHKCPTQLALAL